MRVTYIQHSGFLVEWEDVACLFDWAEGAPPKIDPRKKLLVFVSHSHADHYTPEIFARCVGVPRRIFVLASDITELPSLPKKETVVRMEPNRRRVLNGGERGPLAITTLRSTDKGVAFVVSYGGRTIYHAGDLHWWAWEDDDPEAEKRMKDSFAAEIAKLKGLPLDAAFLPLDPRLGENFAMGFDAFMRMAEVRAAFPMHMWERYETVDALRHMDISAPYRERIMDVREPGQIFELE